MPFFLYSLDSQPGQYRQIREISLSGKASPFRKLAPPKPEANGTRPACASWLCLKLNGPAEHRILIDLKPSYKNNVSLYRLRDVWVTPTMAGSRWRCAWKRCSAMIGETIPQPSSMDLQAQ